MDKIMLIRTPDKGRWNLECAVTARQKELFKIIGLDSAMINDELKKTAEELARAVTAEDMKKSSKIAEEDLYREDEEDLDV